MAMASEWVHAGTPYVSPGAGGPPYYKLTKRFQEWRAVSGGARHLFDIEEYEPEWGNTPEAGRAPNVGRYWRRRDTGIVEGAAAQAAPDASSEGTTPPATQAVPLPAEALKTTATGPVGEQFRTFGPEGLPLVPSEDRGLPAGGRVTPGGGNPNEMYQWYREAWRAGYDNYKDLWNLSPDNAISGYNRWKNEGQPGADPPPAGESPPSEAPPAGESPPSEAPPVAPLNGEAAPGLEEGDAPSTGNAAWDQSIKDLSDRLAVREDEAERIKGLLAEAEQGRIRAELAQAASAQQLDALDVLSQPRASFFSQFARAPESKAEKPVFIQAGPELSAVMRPGGRVPSYGTIGGPLETIENTPEAIRRAFEGAVAGLTTESIQGLTPTALAQLGVLGQIGGYFPTDVFRARELAIPREPKLFKSLQAR